MATNPMQRKTRNAFLLGALISLIICLLIGVLFYLLIGSNKNKGEMKTVAVLNKDLKAGDQITTASFSTFTTYADLVPANALDASGLKSIIDTLENEAKTKGESADNIKVVAAIDLAKNTVLTKGQILKSDVTDDVRYVEYNMLIIGTTAKVGSYVDIRITFPNGLDLIVASKKRIETLNGNNTVGFYMNEGEIELMESAIVESYIMTASKMYLVEYAATTQKAAIKTYTPTEAVRTLIANDSNITTQAKEALESRFNEGIRINQNNVRSIYSETEKENLEEGILQEIEDAKKAREEYLSSVPTAATNQTTTATTTSR